METLADPLLVGGGKALETFLGGMETSIGSSGIVPPATLKPSLVEWKQTKTWAELAKWYNP